MPLQHFLNSQFKVGVGLKLWVFSTSFFHSVHLINLHWIGFKCFHQGVEMQYKRNSLWLFLSYFSTTLNRLSLRAKCEIDWKPIVICLKKKNTKKSNLLSDHAFPVWVSCSLSKRGSSVFGLVDLLIFLQLQVAHWAERKLIYLCQSRRPSRQPPLSELQRRSAQWLMCLFAAQPTTLLCYWKVCQ